MHRYIVFIALLLSGGCSTIAGEKECYGNNWKYNFSDAMQAVGLYEFEFILRGCESKLQIDEVVNSHATELCGADNVSVDYQTTDDVLLGLSGGTGPYGFSSMSGSQKAVVRVNATLTCG